MRKEIKELKEKLWQEINSLYVTDPKSITESAIIDAKIETLKCVIGMIHELEDRR